MKWESVVLSRADPKLLLAQTIGPAQDGLLSVNSQHKLRSMACPETCSMPFRYPRCSEQCASNRLGTILKHASIKAEGGATAFGSQKGKVASEFSGKPQPSFFSRI
ncbi:hypothetical protein KL937_002795 [Ogataea polymorpha]|nr:hypothetical protein KL937_002795 [Ogataea polymorpha]KAG7937794.1 hypothetical protein KL904_001941 [Ogataea polymorpha]